MNAGYMQVRARTMQVRDKDLHARIGDGQKKAEYGRRKVGARLTLLQYEKFEHERSRGLADEDLETGR